MDGSFAAGRGAVVGVVGEGLGVDLRRREISSLAVERIAGSRSIGHGMLRKWGIRRKFKVCQDEVRVTVGGFGRLRGIDDLLVDPCVPRLDDMKILATN